LVLILVLLIDQAYQIIAAESGVKSPQLIF